VPPRSRCNTLTIDDDGPLHRSKVQRGQFIDEELEQLTTKGLGKSEGFMLTACQAWLCPGSISMITRGVRRGPLARPTVCRTHLADLTGICPLAGHEDVQPLFGGGSANAPERG
jgi:hypothetical protein